jgi:hypothetical protein
MIVTTIFDRIIEALARGQKVELRGFGVSVTKPRSARAGRNPRTGEELPVVAKTALNGFATCSPQPVPGTPAADVDGVAIVRGDDARHQRFR